MPITAPEVVSWAGTALLEGQFEGLLPHYDDTVAVFAGDSIYRLRGASEILAALAEHRQGALDRGVVGLTGKIVAVSLPRGPRFRLFIDWVYDLGLGRQERTAAATYYCRTTAAGPKVEMIDYRRLAFQQSRSWHEGRDLILKAAA